MTRLFLILSLLIPGCVIAEVEGTVVEHHSFDVLYPAAELGTISVSMGAPLSPRFVRALRDTVTPRNSHVGKVELEAVVRPLVLTLDAPPVGVESCAVTLGIQGPVIVNHRFTGSEQNSTYIEIPVEDLTLDEVRDSVLRSPYLEVTFRLAPSLSRVRKISTDLTIDVSATATLHP